MWLKFMPGHIFYLNQPPQPYLQNWSDTVYSANTAKFKPQLSAHNFLFETVYVEEKEGPELQNRKLLAGYDH